MSSKLTNWSGPAFVVGGLLWIAHYAIWIAVGLLTGDVPVWGTASAEVSITSVGYLDLISFCGAILCFAAGLYGVGAVLKGGSKVLRAIGIFFASLAGIMGAGGLVTQVFGLASTTGLFMGNGVIASLLGATFLSVAALRTGALRKGSALLLLANGILTFPLIVSIVSILPALPAYMVDELPFAISGLAWILIGRAQTAEHGRPISSPEPTGRRSLSGHRQTLGEEVIENERKQSPRNTSSVGVIR